MLKAFILSFKLNNTYSVNSIIKLLKQTSIVDNILPNDLYKNKGLKTFANVISLVVGFIKIFLGKFIYLLLIIYLSKMYTNSSLAFLNILFFLSIVGGLINTSLFMPTVSSYYAVILMRFDAKKYALCNYYYLLIKTIIGFLPFTIMYSLMFNLNIMVGILLPFVIAAIKNIICVICLYQRYTTTASAKSYPYVTVITGILLALAFILPILNIGINQDIFYVLSLILIPVGIYALVRISVYPYYHREYKIILNKRNVFNSQDNKAMITQNYNNIIEGVEVTSDKKGYAYFNELFAKRHRKLLTKACRNITLTSIILFIIVVIALYIYPSYNEEVNNVLKTMLPYYLFVMYIINRGENITRTMFVNCDSSMLTYRFYRQGSFILGLFKERLKTLTFLNFVPAFVIALGSVILLYISGGALMSEYIIMFLTIISMSIFFSVHYLVMYYLLQPYNVDFEQKNPIFHLVCYATYFISYWATRVQTSIMLFGIGMIIFTVIYSLISLYIVYKYAPKTFKLRN